MPGYLVHEQATMTCPHGGTVSIVAGQPRTSALAMKVMTSASLVTVAGCPFQVPIPTGTKPQPCVTVKWANVSARVKVLGLPVAVQATPSGTGGGICLSVEQIPQGPPNVVFVQGRAFAT